MAKAADRINAYATALFEVAQTEGKLDTIKDELLVVANALEQNEELRKTLTDPAVPIDRRQGIVEDLLGKRASAITTSLVSFVVGTGRAREFSAIVKKVVQMAADARDEEVAEVRTAIPLDDDQRRRLAEALGQATGKKITVNVVVDPTVLGGVVAKVGDTVIDGSIRHRLDTLRAAL